MRTGIGGRESRLVDAGASTHGVAWSGDHATTGEGQARSRSKSRIKIRKRIKSKSRIMSRMIWRRR
jgi:hypothetical protein